MGDQTIGAKTKNKETATIPNAIGKNTCKRNKLLEETKRDNCHFVHYMQDKKALFVILQGQLYALPQSPLLPGVMPAKGVTQSLI